MTDLRAKHQPIEQRQGAIGSVTYCAGCKTPSGVLANLWPCEVIEALEDETYRRFFDNVEAVYLSDDEEYELVDRIGALIDEINRRGSSIEA
jgi:hypothetical protein